MEPKSTQVPHQQTQTIRPWRRFRAWVKGIGFTVGFLILLLMGLVVALRMPRVQTWAARHLTDLAREKTGFDVRIGYVSLNWFDRLVLHNVDVYDVNRHQMIHIDDAVLDFGWPRLLTRNVAFDEIWANNGHLDIITDRKNQVNITVFVDRLTNWLSPIDSTKLQKLNPLGPASFHIADGGLRNFRVTINDLRHDSLPEPFDMKHITLDSLNLTLKNFRSRADTIEMQVVNLLTRERKSHLKVAEFRTFFRMTRKNMAFEPLYARIGNSVLQDSIHFSYYKPAQMSELVDSIPLNIRFKKAKLSTDDIALFAPALAKYHDKITLTGNATGTFSDLKLTQMKAGFGKSSFMQGRLSMKGLFNIDSTFMNIALHRATVHPEDLRPYVPPVSMPALQKLGTTDFETTFTGYISSFQVDGLFFTNLGGVRADLRMDLKGDAKSTYYGDFILNNFEVGKLAGTRQVGQVSGRGHVDGRGFRLETAHMYVKGNFDRLNVLGRTYRNVETNAKLARMQFNGLVNIRDSNLVARAEGLADLRGKRKIFDLSLDVKRARLHVLGLATEPTTFSGAAYLSGAAASVDDANGIILLEDAKVVQVGRSLALKELKLETRQVQGRRRVELTSDLANGYLEGNFTFAEFGRDMEAALNDYGRQFRNAKALSNSRNVYSKRNYTIEGDFSLFHLTPLLQYFSPQLQIADDAHATLLIQKNKALLTQLDVSADYLAYGDNVWDLPKLDLVSSKSLDSANILASLSITSPSQRWGNKYSKELVVDGSWQGKQIDFRTAIRSGSDTNYADVSGQLLFMARQVQASLTHAAIHLYDTTWRVSEANRLTYDGKRLMVDSLRISAGPQRLLAQGVLGPNPADSLQLSTDSLSLAFLNEIIAGPFGGTVQAGLTLSQGLSAEPVLFGRLHVPGLTYKGTPLGDLNINLLPEKSLSQLALNMDVTQGDRKLLTGSGWVRPRGEQNWNLNFGLTGTPVKYMEPLLQDFAGEWQGQAFGHMDLAGTFSKPVLTGRLLVENGGFQINYLKTQYTFTDSVILEPTLISANGLVLRDQNRNICRLTRARMRHRNFEDFFFDLRGDLKNFQVLGTGYRDSDLYYGSVYTSGDLYVRGEVGNIVIGGDLQTSPGTRLYLPISNALAGGATQAGFIHFVNAKADSAAKRDSLNNDRVNLTGLRLNFNLDVTPDAVGEIILNRQTGDIIRVRGNGAIKMRVDTRGDFSMAGLYNVTEGSYRFTFSNFINKDFAILPNSTITWSGDPAAAQLDIYASYNQYVSLTPLLSGYNGPDSAQRNAEASRRYPANVKMHLTGAMLSPQINLSLDIPNSYPSSLGTFVTAFQAAVQNNDQELNKQVFSLMLLKSFSPIGSNVYAGAGSTVGNFSELLANQLSSWLSDVNQNLEVGVNLNGFDTRALENLQLRLSYTLMDGRLRITRAGNFTNTQNSATAASVAGDWTVEYMLTQDGKLRAKMFHRTNQTLANVGIGLGNQYYTTSQGVSLMHTQSFDTLGELFPQWLYKRKKRKLEEQGVKPTESEPVVVPLPRPSVSAK